MVEYFKMKKNEWKVKCQVYAMIAKFMDNQKEYLGFLQNLYIALKDVPFNELRNEVVSKLAEIIHEENKNNGNH